jgi:predicted Fe-Mo cluster-binding NifX family protein
MRIAISADNEDGLDSVVSPHFGRCPYYIIADVEEKIKEVQAVDNPYYGRHAPGQVPEFISSQGVNVMLTGGMGRRAIALFEQYGIEAVTGASGTVRQALELYLGGELQGVVPCRQSREHDHPAAGEYEKDEVGRLREEAEMLRQQLDDATRRLKEIES